MKLAVLHTREFDDYAKFAATLDQLTRTGVLTISGIVAGGPATLAVRYAQERKLPCQVIAPNYIRHGSNAAETRNQAIIKSSDGLLAFHDGQSRSTAEAIRLARVRTLSFVLVIPVTTRPKLRSAHAPRRPRP